jgi:hypothetical protein
MIFAIATVAVTVTATVAVMLIVNTVIQRSKQFTTERSWLLTIRD